MRDLLRYKAAEPQVPGEPPAQPEPRRPVLRVVPQPEPAADAIDVAGRRARFCMSAQTVDRVGEVLVASGVALDNFLTNPVGLWRHQSQTMPIGAWEDIEVRDGDGVYGWLRFGTTKEAEDAWTLVREGILRGASVGYLELEQGAPILPGQTGPTIRRWELVECSLCPDPCNPQALLKAVAAGVSQKTLAALWPEEAEQLRAQQDDYAAARLTGNLRRLKGAAEGVLNGLKHAARQAKEGKAAFEVTSIVRDEDLAAAIAAARQVGELYQVQWEGDGWADWILGQREVPREAEGGESATVVTCGHCGCVWAGPCCDCPACHGAACPACGYCAACGSCTCGGAPGIVPPPTVCSQCDCAYAAGTCACPTCGGNACPDCGWCPACGAATSAGNAPGEGKPLPVDCPNCAQSWCGATCACPQCGGNACPGCGYCSTCGAATSAGNRAASPMAQRSGTAAPRGSASPHCPGCRCHEHAPADATTRTPPPEPDPAPGAPSDAAREEKQGLTAAELDELVERLVPAALERRLKQSIGGSR